ncbi:TolB family protein [Streptomyces sp. NPDC008222]|uniref:TolB family protein n=1 Tax=Streptomyces sp. NPDC008222 TaxID=3364820 RepID=UPI0036EF8A4C
MRHMFVSSQAVSPLRTVVAGVVLASALGLSALPPASAASQGAAERISTAANGAQLAAASHDGTVSADGHYASYETQGPGEGCPATFSTCLFVKDLRTGRLVEIPGTGVYAGNATISADGRRVAFDTGNRFLKPYVYDRKTAQTQPLWPQSLPPGPGFELGNVAAISANGNQVAYTIGNRNGNYSSPYLYVRDLVTGTDDLVTPLQPEGNVTGARLSADGRFVAYGVHSGDQTVLYVKDRATGAVRRFDTAPDGTPANDYSEIVRLSNDGRRVLFNSRATNLLPGGPVQPEEQAYIADLHTGRIQRVGDSGALALAADDGCRFVLLKQYGAEPSEQQGDVVLLDVRTGRKQRLAPAAASATALPGAVARHGREVVFTSAAADLVPGDTNGVSDVFVLHLK